MKILEMVLTSANSYFNILHGLNRTTHILTYLHKSPVNERGVQAGVSMCQHFARGQLIRLNGKQCKSMKCQTIDGKLVLNDPLAMVILSAIIKSAPKCNNSSSQNHQHQHYKPLSLFNNNAIAVPVSLIGQQA